jgi:hypothetical protein
MKQPSQARAPTKKHVTLFLAAHPCETERLALDREGALDSRGANLERCGSPSIAAGRRTGVIARPDQLAAFCGHLAPS